MKLDIKALLAMAVVAGALAFFFLAPTDGLQAAPTPEMTTVDGDAIDPDKLSGKPYMVVFWATDCPGCIKEIPHLNELYSEFGKEGFEVIAIAMPHDQVDQIKTMRSQKSMSYKIVFDEDGTLAKAYGGVSLTPTNLLISPEGKVALHKVGTFNPANIRQLVTDMLKG
ncbi:MAG: Redoxin domain protein [uncultured Thiotrichaceae bacterium]|uniref:Redoxin domain protein n=1 Tax=uncultured Thiotrichaceae bacterium TaxID=298394 RepID=A0A6S6SY36_9GAMM|nr:MAG: Redoxin domain protein [uncultured Thiotrichaceae bacterium]